MQSADGVHFVYMYEGSRDRKHASRSPSHNKQSVAAGTQPGKHFQVTISMERYTHSNLIVLESNEGNRGFCACVCVCDGVDSTV